MTHHANDQPRPDLPKLQLPTFTLRSRELAPVPPPALHEYPQAPTSPSTEHVRGLFDDRPLAPPLSPPVGLRAAKTNQQPAAHHAHSQAHAHAHAHAPQPGLRPAHVVHAAHAHAAPQAPVQQYHQPAAAATTVRPAFAVSGAPGPAWSFNDRAEQDGMFAKLTPLHVAMLVSLVAFAFVISQGVPGARSALPVASLPAQPGTTTATLPLARDPQGIPSAATAASVKAERSGKAAPRSQRAAKPVRKMNGIPSAAATATMEAKTLPLRPSDGMTLPRTIGERDGHSVERHYVDTLPMEREVARPAVTPGQAAVQAEVARDYEQATSDPYAAAPGSSNVAF